MEHNQQQQYGNPTHQTVMTGGETDQYGNPVHQTGAMGAGTGTGMHAGEHQQQQHQSDVLHRSGSSSSEDDGQGGRRKKGIKEKIKERIPGVGHKDEQKHTSATTTPGQGQVPGQRLGQLPGQGQGQVPVQGQVQGQVPVQGQGHKGIMDKIPCVGHKDEQKHTSATTTPGQGQLPGQGKGQLPGQGQGPGQQQKGMMEKIKEKLPGSH